MPKSYPLLSLEKKDDDIDFIDIVTLQLCFINDCYHKFILSLNTFIYIELEG